MIKISFNPRTRTGCDVIWYSGWQYSFKFQSTHPHGVRLTLHIQPQSNGYCFNPRTRTGCDRSINILSAENALVSIHAPARGATQGNIHLYSLARFQSTHPHGVRQFLIFFRQYKYKFQSTHPHGVRHKEVIQQLDAVSFNPRTRTGCDRISRPIRYFRYVSIHAPARGATK